MHFAPFYLSCLSHGSYLLGSGGEALVIDPQRDIEVYLAAAAEAGLKIRGIVETHLHADFVSGHHELAARTGATVYVGKRATVGFTALPVGDGDTIRMGALTIDVLETPGHTPESICLLVTDTDNPSAPPKLFTGDTLFIGDVGRPDLVGSKGFTSQDMAGMLYDSLHDKIMPLADAVEIYPAHGAGSACGRAISDERSSTIGIQRQTNYALQPMGREEFVRMMTENLAPAPGYFSHAAQINQAGAPSLSDLPAIPALPADEVADRLQNGVWLLDVRSEADYLAAHPTGAVCLGLEGRFASWVGTLIPTTESLILIAPDAATLAETQLRLARIGYDRVDGVLAGSPADWVAAGLPVRKSASLSPAEIQAHLADGWQLLDVRRKPEFQSGHIGSAVHRPVDRLMAEGPAVDPHKPTVVMCGSGYRSVAAIGLLERLGVTAELANATDGMDAWAQSRLPVVIPVG